MHAYYMLKYGSNAAVPLNFQNKVIYTKTVSPCSELSGKNPGKTDPLTVSYGYNLFCFNSYNKKFSHPSPMLMPHRVSNSSKILVFFDATGDGTITKYNTSWPYGNSACMVDFRHPMMTAHYLMLDGHAITKNAASSKDVSATGNEKDRLFAP